MLSPEKGVLLSRRGRLEGDGVPAVGVEGEWCQIRSRRIDIAVLPDVLTGVLADVGILWTYLLCRYSIVVENLSPNDITAPRPSPVGLLVSGISPSFQIQRQSRRRLAYPHQRGQPEHSHRFPEEPACAEPVRNWPAAVLRQPN